ncbi:hypothetical protein [Laceyella putida]|uniref:Uncharacterized protein n=1 Tax=Laceyella putida TaxID=110101 RepID=A0ABW2RJ77_9BACL
MKQRDFRSIEQQQKERENKQASPAMKTTGTKTFVSDKKLTGPDRPST